MADAFDLIAQRQWEWALHRQLEADPRGYLPTVQSNLFAPLMPETLAEYQSAAGGELADGGSKPAKMRALCSSSALVCNVFDYWRHRDSQAVARALRIAEPVTRLRFEAPLPTGLRGTPPTLDLLVESDDMTAWAIESKFTEPYQRRSTQVGFTPSYFLPGDGLWAALNLPSCQALALRLWHGETHFTRLDASQLLKHVLGLRRRYPDGRLLLLWYRVDAEASRCFESEMLAFADAVDEELGFRALTYQQVFAHLAGEPDAVPEYIAYLRSRYFAD